MSVAGRAIAAALLLCGGVAAASAQELSLRQPDGKTVTVIDDKGVGGPFQQWIERRNADGSLDLAFGSSGRVSLSPGGDILELRSLSQDAQGRLVLAGAALGSGDRATAVVSRFLTDGRADARWGTQGTSRVASADGNVKAVDSLAMPDQGMLLLGQLDTAAGPKVVLYRLHFDGTADASFGRGGVLHLAPLDGSQPTSLRHDDDGTVLIASQRARAGGLLLEAHRWQQGHEGVQLVARQDAPPGWPGPATLERRDGRWQWTDPGSTGALPLVFVDDAGSPSTASTGQAAFNPFAAGEASKRAEPLLAFDRSVLPGPGWLWLVPLAAVLGIVLWRRRFAGVADLGLLDARAATLKAATTEFARPTPAPHDDLSGPTPGTPDDLLTPTPVPPDDLKRIKGIGPVLERHLNEQGIFYFRQIAQWRPADVAEVGARLSAFKGRIERDRWVAQAIELSR